MFGRCLVHMCVSRRCIQRLELLVEGRKTATIVEML